MGKMSEIWEGEVAGYRDEEMELKGCAALAQQFPGHFFCWCLCEYINRKHVKPVPSLEMQFHRQQ